MIIKPIKKNHRILSPYSHFLKKAEKILAVENKLCYNIKQRSRNAYEMPFFAFIIYNVRFLFICLRKKFTIQLGADHTGHKKLFLFSH